MRSAPEGDAAVLVADARAPGFPLVQADEAFERITGYAAADVLGRGASLLYGPETDEAAIADIRRAEAEGRPASVTLRCHGKDGTAFPAALTLTPVAGADGRPTHLVYVLATILVAGEALVGVAEDAEIGIALTTPAGRFFHFNRAFCEITGYDEDALRQLDFQSITHPDDLEGDVDLVEKLLAGAISSFRLEKRYVRPDGSTPWARVHVALARDADGEPAHFVSLVEDITERVRAQEALADSERRFRGAFDAAPIGMALVSPEGRYLRINQALCDLLGYAEDELLELTFQAISHPGEVERNTELFGRALAGEIDAYRLEKRYVHKQGHEVWGALTASVVRDGEGKPEYLVAEVVDITARRLADETLARREAVLAAVASSAQLLLRATAWEDAIDEVLRELGEAADVSRAYVFRALPNADDGYRISALHEWVAPGIEPQTGDPSLQDHVPAGTEAEWMRTLARGEIVQGQVPTEQGIVSLVLVPVTVADGFWGFLGFDECLHERTWTTAETEALRAAAGGLGAAIQRRVLETRYRTLVEQLPLTTYIETIETGRPLMYISPQIVPILGYSTEEWTNDSELWGRIVHPDDRSAAYESEWPDDDGPHRLEYRAIARDGREVWFLDESSLVRDDEGNRLYSQGYMLDITERRRMEEELRRTNEMLRTVVHASPLGIVVTDLDGAVTFWSSAAERIYGWSSMEAIGRLPRTRPPELADEYRQFHEACERGEWINAHETRRLRKDGATIDVSISLAPLHDTDGRFVGVLGVHEDITERKDLESQLMQSQRLEAVGRLAGGIAHDFNNLLTAISGYSEFLLDALETTDPSRRDVTEIARAADRAAALVRQLLAFSRRQMMRTRVVDLNEVIVDTETLLRRLIGEDVTLVTRLDPRLPAIRADPAQLEQIVVNLAVNARDAMPAGGTLSIDTEADAASGTVRLIVTDTGVGMDMETAEHAFEPFFTTKDPGKGTGLGLSTVYGIVVQSGGTVDLRSEPGLGTSFTVTLPALDRDTSAPPADGQPTGLRRGSETLLLVEDERFVRDLAERVLGGAGYTVLSAASGEEALELATDFKGEIELLVTDLVMPGMGGRELADRLLAARPGVRVLYTSGYGDAEAFPHETRPGEFIGKPFTPESLRRKVAEVLDA